MKRCGCRRRRVSGFCNCDPGDGTICPRRAICSPRWRRECHIEIQGTDRIPHDLWAAGDLPPLNLTDRLTLVAAQFDLTFAIDPTGESVSLVEMPATVEISRSYPFHLSIVGGRQCDCRKLVESAARGAHSIQRWKAAGSRPGGGSGFRRGGAGWPAGEADHRDERRKALHRADRFDGRRRVDQNARPASSIWTCRSTTRRSKRPGCR